MYGVYTYVNLMPSVYLYTAAQGKKGRVMERRLLKDFQIGLVEGLIQDAMSTSEKGPKDVFSKIAKAIGRRTSQGGSKKKDWNAVVRQKSLARDPIGSTAEGTERRHRQSVRRYILDHQKDCLMSMDANRLVEYNPLLAEMAPAARVAYAKFKIPKIKQEYEENTVGADEVFENVPTVDVVDETKKSSIARPRPKSTRQSPVAGALPFPSTDGDKQPPANAATESTKSADDGSQKKAKKIQKVKTIELNDIAPAVVTTAPPTGTQKKEQSEPGPSTSQEAAKDSDDKSQPSTSGPGGQSSKDAEKKRGDEGSKKKDGDGTTDVEKPDDADNAAGTDKSKDTDKAKGTDKSKDTDKPKDKGDKNLKPESPKRSASPRKAGGKSKVTGEILTGWL